jgi:hypothetical protein
MFANERKTSFIAPQKYGWNLGERNYCIHLKTDGLKSKYPVNAK